MTRRRSGLLGLAALMAAIGGACNFETSFRIATHVDPGAPGEQFRDACHDQAVMRCSYDARCDPFFFSLAWPDAATCEERETLACQLVATDPSSTYDDASIRSCALPAEMPCPSEPGYDSAQAAFQVACQRPPGELPDGAACEWHSACASGSCLPDLSLNADVCGACAPPPCGGGCAQGEACLISGPTTKCLGAAGAPCTKPAECAMLRCQDGLCAARLGIGAACDPSETYDPCAFDAYCDSTTETCRPFAVVQAYEPCGLLPAGWTVCGGGATCLVPTCSPPAADGALCDPSQGRNCLGPARCIHGYCRFHWPACTPPT